MLPLLRDVDCIRVRVPELDAGLAFYRDTLGHALLWRNASAAGLAMPDCTAEIVIHTDPTPEDVNLSVDSVEHAIAVVVSAGGRVLAGPFDIAIGKCVVVADPFGNPLTLLDKSKGLLATDLDGNVTGLKPR